MLNMIRGGLFSLVLCSLSFSGSLAVWLDEGGGYQDVTVAVHSAVDISDCSSFMESIQSLATYFSENLWEATRGHVHLSSLNVVVPGRVARRCNVTFVGGRHSWTQADIRLINGRHSSENWAPTESEGVGVQQPSGCGLRGDFITVDYSLLSALKKGQEYLGLETNRTQVSPDDVIRKLGRSLVAAWARYRWGVFEETDSATNHVIESDLDDKRNGTSPQTENSLLKDVSGKLHFCDMDDHDPLIPTPHNMICRGKSAWEVMRTHPDFNAKRRPPHFEARMSLEAGSKNHLSEASSDDDKPMPRQELNDSVSVSTNETDGNMSNDLSPKSEVDHRTNRSQAGSEIEFVPTEAGVLAPVANQSVTWIKDRPRPPESPPKIRLISSPAKAVIVALDLSTSFVAQASVEWLRGGILRWMFGVGDGINIGILASFGNSSVPLSSGPLAPGPTTARHLEENMALLPNQHEVDDDVYGGKFCLPCVVDEAEKMFRNAGVPLESGVLILTVCQPQLATHLMRVSSLFFAVHTVTVCQNAPLYVEKLASPDGSWALSSVSMETGTAAEVQFGNLLTEICRKTLLWPTDLRLKTVHEEDRLVRRDDVENMGAFKRIKGTIKASKSRNVRLFVLTSSASVKVVELWDGKKRLSLHRDTNRRFWSLLEDDVGTLSYSLKFLSSSLEFPLNLATAIYEKSEEVGFNVDIQSSAKRYNILDPYLTVWAEVTYNGKPVMNTDVTLSVTYLSGHSPATYSLMLLDSGSTEPDIRRGDGIYSRFLTWTPGSGRYILTATASTSSNSYYHSMKNNVLTRKRMGVFTAVSSAISLVLEMVQGGDLFPPSRITDLAVCPQKGSLVNLTWSAPGGDLDQGSAWRYQLKMYTESSALKQERFDSSGIEVYCVQGDERAPMPAPALFGTPQYCVTSLPFSNLRWYFAMRAIDGANNTGRISNVVSAFIREATPTSKTPLRKNVQTVVMSAVSPTVTSADMDSWRIYGIALVAAILLVMLMIVVFACACCYRKAKSKAKKDPDRPIYKIYVNNAYIQEEDGEVKAIKKEKPLDTKDPTLQWVNSLDKFGQREENQADISVDTTDSSNSPGKFPKPVRFGVLTNGSIMRELPSSSSSSSSKPYDEAVPEDFKYRDLAETTSTSTSDGATGSTSSTATEVTTAETLRVKDIVGSPYKVVQPLSYGVSYQPLGIPTLPGPTVISIHSDPHNGYNSEDDGGFKSRMAAAPGPRKHLPSQYCSFRYLQPVEGNKCNAAQVVYPAVLSTISQVSSTAITVPAVVDTVPVGQHPHGTVRSVKKRRHISFV